MSAKKSTKGKKSTGSTRADAPPEEPVAPLPPPPASVGVVEAGASHRDRAVRVIAELGYEIHDAGDIPSARAALSSRPPDVLLVGLPDAAELIAAALALEDRPVLVAAMAGPATNAYQRCDEVGADLFTLRPHNRDGLAAVLRAAVQMALVRDRERALRGTEERLRERLQRYGAADQVTGFQHIDFFKSFLTLELKRAKRYGYSLAACLVALDPEGDGGGDASEADSDLEDQRRRTRVAEAMASAMRDIDLPVDLSDDRFLAFLPYTDLEGAERVGRRIAAAVRSAGVGGSRPMSVSVGIAALRSGGPVSFARIMRDASMALRAAQLKGGGRVVAKR